MRYELLHINDENVKIFARIEDDGNYYITCSEENPDYLRWLNGEDEAQSL
jgi:hypothetical protein